MLTGFMGWLQMGPQFNDIAQGLSGLASNFGGSGNGAGQSEAIELLADTIDGWLQTQSSAVNRILPPPTDSVAS